MNGTDAPASVRVAVLPGDGIGAEVVPVAVAVLRAALAWQGVRLETTEGLAGGCAIDAAGEPLPAETLALCRGADAVLLGAVGGPQWENLPMDQRPEKGLLGLRAGLGLFANLRPALLFAPLAAASSLKPELVSGLDILILRELTGGIYFGEPRGIFLENNERVGVNTYRYAEHEIERIARVAFDLAGKRQGRLCSVDKANVLEATDLWRQVVSGLAGEYPEVALSHMYVDNAGMQLVRAPKQFDVILTGNMFGDILSDVAAMLTGSLGMLPSASLAADGFGLYEPVHGSAPDIAGQDAANPLAAVLSAAMLCRSTRSTCLWRRMPSRRPWTPCWGADCALRTLPKRGRTFNWWALKPWATPCWRPLKPSLPSGLDEVRFRVCRGPLRGQCLSRRSGDAQAGREQGGIKRMSNQDCRRLQMGSSRKGQIGREQAHEQSELSAARSFGMISA